MKASLLGNEVHFTRALTVQLASVYDGKASILIDLKKLKTTALFIGALFLVTVAMRIYGIVTST